MKTQAKLISHGKIKAPEGYHCTWDFALIVGDAGFVLTANDFVHKVYHDLGDAAQIPMWKNGRKETRNGEEFEVFEMESSSHINMTLGELKATQGDPINFKEWGHYFGIKKRIAANYNILKRSCREIGAEVDFPPWRD